MRVGFVIVAAVLVAGCAVGPDYEAPDIETPGDFRFQIEEGAAFSNLNWWEVFQDDELNRLIDIALEESRDLAIATARIDEARAFYGFTRADLYPRIDGAATGQRGNTAQQIIPGVGVINNYVLSANLNWEIDVFGKLRRANQAALAGLLAEEQNRRAVYITLIADVASAYFLLRDLDARREIAERTLATRQNSTRIIRERFNKGTKPLLDVNQAEIQEAQAAADLAAFARQVAEAENLISALIGRNPGPIARGAALAEQVLPPDVPAGLPSELLTRRPDVLAAEQALIAQTANIGVAQALRFPSLTLTGTAGYISNELSSLTDRESSIFEFRGDVFQPLINWGQNKRRVEIERARAEQLLNNYELTILLAFREVEDSLVAIRTLRDEYAARQMQVRAAESAARLSRARYDGGVTSYLEVLDIERSLFQAEIAASSVRRQRLTAVVDLYKALGGGWDETLALSVLPASGPAASTPLPTAEPE